MGMITSQLLILSLVFVAFGAVTAPFTMPSKTRPREEQDEMEYASKVLAYLQQQDYQQQVTSPVQDNLDAAIESLMSSFVGGLKKACRIIPLRDDRANAQLLGGIFRGGLNMVKGACKVINTIGGERAIIEGTFGFSLEDLKKRGKQVLEDVTAICELYNNSKTIVKQLVGDKAQDLDLICQGLNTGTPAVIQALLDSTVRSIFEDKE